jgi:hypothetical protein
VIKCCREEPLDEQQIRWLFFILDCQRGCAGPYSVIGRVLRIERRRCTVRAMVSAALACAVLAACTGDLDLPSDRSWRSRHFDNRTRASDQSICSDILGPLEDHFAVL